MWRLLSSSTGVCRKVLPDLGFHPLVSLPSRLAAGSGRLHNFDPRHASQKMRWRKFASPVESREIGEYGGWIT
ncbi:unnamed protein product [Cuscuta campestris]|uniref:Uncharacterized protein n=1 Tax=Cuscuta campestris TaxID=132261 RepID=A0A484K922_9ASTE|nr:unnamed protein product [Cuscuta campestris]